MHDATVLSLGTATYQMACAQARAFGMSLRAGLDKQEILVAPGIYDGLRTANEMTDMMTLIADHTDLPVIIDADTGFGNALNVHRTIRLYQRFSIRLILAVRSSVG